MLAGGRGRGVVRSRGRRESVTGNTFFLVQGNGDCDWGFGRIRNEAIGLLGGQLVNMSKFYYYYHLHFHSCMHIFSVS